MASSLPTVSPPTDPRLLAAIAAPDLQRRAIESVQAAVEALVDLQRLDETLYARFVASRAQPGLSTESAEVLRQLWGDTFRGVRRLLEVCQRPLAEEGQPRGGDEAADLDFGDLESAAPAPLPSDLALAADDIGELVDNLGAHSEKSEAERWQQLLGKLSSVEYGLRTQLGDGDSRLEGALRSGSQGQALELLDDTQGALSEGVYALVAAVYQAFVPDAEHATLVPGYLTTLGRALLVRRGLASLAAAIGPRNDVLQAEDPQGLHHESALTAIRSLLADFVASDVCRAMRPADRWQLSELERSIREQAPGAARLGCEGLAKYLESLASINQREVLLLHDHRMLQELRESISAARQLEHLSRHTFEEMVGKAYHAALELYGRHPTTDPLIQRLARSPPDFAEMGNSAAVLASLEELLAALGE